MPWTDQLHQHANLRIAEANSGRLFHPKLYVFHLAHHQPHHQQHHQQREEAAAPECVAEFEFEFTTPTNDDKGQARAQAQAETEAEPGTEAPATDGGQQIAAYFNLIWAGAEPSTPELLSSYRESWKPVSQLYEYLPATPAVTLFGKVSTHPPGSAAQSHPATWTLGPATSFS
jgi:hypothetical protein